MANQPSQSTDLERIEITYRPAARRMRVYLGGAPRDCLAQGVFSVTVPAPYWVQYEQPGELFQSECDLVWWGASLAVMRGLAADLRLLGGCDPRGGGCAVRVIAGGSLCDPPRGQLEGVEDLSGG